MIAVDRHRRLVPVEELRVFRAADATRIFVQAQPTIDADMPTLRQTAVE